MPVIKRNQQPKQALPWKLRALEKTKAVPESYYGMSTINPETPQGRRRVQLLAQYAHTVGTLPKQNPWGGSIWTIQERKWVEEALERKKGLKGQESKQER